MLKHKVALGCGFFAIFFVGHGIGALAIPYYQMTLGVDPFLLGLVLTIPVLFSALISPWAATVIDTFSPVRHSHRLILIASGWFCALSFAAMWRVPTHWSDTLSILYLFGCSLIFFFFATFMTVVVRCLAVESTSESRELTAVMGFTTVFEKLGSIIYFWLFPLAQSKLFFSLTLGMKTIGLWVSVLLIGMLSSISGLLCRSRAKRAIAPENNPTSTPFSPSLHSQVKWLFAVTVIQFGLIGVCVNLDFYVLVYFVNAGDIAQGAIWKGYLSTGYALFGLLAIPVIVKAGNRYGKKRTLQFIYVINCINAVSKWFVYQPGMEYWLIVDSLLGTWVWTAHTTLIPALLADICYENQRITGSLSDSYVVARHNRVANLALVISFVGSGLLLNVIGFNADTTVAQSDSVLFTMRLVLVAGSLVFSGLALLVLSKFTFQRTVT